MQLPAGKPAELLQRFGGFNGGNKLAQFVGHRGRHTSGVPVLVELPEPFVAKADNLHVIPSGFLRVRLYRTRQALLLSRRKPATELLPSGLFPKFGSDGLSFWPTELILLPCPACYHHAMPDNGPLELDDKIVRYKNGNIHREDGPAIEFKGGSSEY
jgi:hypothetical protein